MAQRSTRNKIKFNLQSICNKLDSCAEQLYHCARLGAGATKAFEKSQPSIVAGLNVIKETVKKLRSEI